jgi:hypothetical protein
MINTHKAIEEAEHLTVIFREDSPDAEVFCDELRFDVKLKFQGNEMKELLKDKEKMQMTKQYRYMRQFGFTTDDYRVYTNEDLVIGFSKSKIAWIKYRGDMVQDMTLEVR